jgi:hypothetical protein
MNQLTDDLFYMAREEAHAARRQEHRYPFFRAATLQATGSAGDSYPAFVRDVSLAGIGLLHTVPLDVGPVQVSIPGLGEHTLRFTARVTWCRPAGAEWYLSGGRLDSLSVRQSMSLYIAVFKAECSRRLQQRYPFFRPVTIATHGGKGDKVSAFTRDISPEGIGLLHSVNLTPGRVVLSFPGTPDQSSNISTDIRWCKPTSEHCYISGGEFRKLLLQKLQNRVL